MLMELPGSWTRMEVGDMSSEMTVAGSFNLVQEDNAMLAIPCIWSVTPQAPQQPRTGANPGYHVIGVKD